MRIFFRKIRIFSPYFPPMSLPNSEKPSLYMFEWLAVAIFMGFILMLTVISRPIPDSSLQAAHALHGFTSSEIEISIDGAVEKPGKYSVKKGATLQEVLGKATPLPSANLKHLNLKRKLRIGQNIHIPTQEMITIYLQGIVNQPGAYNFPKGTRWVDLKDKELFPAHADLKILDKKKKLKPNEVITLPSKVD